CQRATAYPPQLPSRSPLLSPPPHRPPAAPLFPYTTLFRSDRAVVRERHLHRRRPRPRGLAEDAGVVDERRDRPAAVDDQESVARSEEHTSELQPLRQRVCRLLHGTHHPRQCSFVPQRPPTV